MRSTLKIITILFATILMSCGDIKVKEQDGFVYEINSTTQTAITNPSTKVPPSQQITLTDKGIGPINSIELPVEINQTMATHGYEISKKMCAACHRPDKKFIGPTPKGIMKRRSPEWIMNMILNPEEMLRKDPLAKNLLVEFNYAPMIKQDLTQEDARAILEYYRTLK
jgi:cytochrome c